MKMGLKKVLMFHATLFKVTRNSNTIYDDRDEDEERHLSNKVNPVVCTES